MSTKTIKRHILPAASLGNSRTLTVIRYGDSGAGSKAYIQAGLHADESPGFVVMHHLIDKLDQADAADKIKGQILLVPVANPIGVSQWRDETLQGRFDFYNSINFNRQHLNLTEQIAERIKGRLLDTPEENVALIRKTGKEVLSALVPE
ncbi:MAG: succinylglutamate desuccinylase/aspartoacylase family protein, partial [Deltaproteobacteria bacterium]|nr:succinylglutamate desuccinylase/aspartoacylase family protein [Deltaproteobacteria bacterium]